MDKSVKKKKNFILLAIVLLAIVIVSVFFKSNLIWHSNMNKHLEKIYQKPISIKKDEVFSYKGKEYRIILSTSESKKDELYLQCFEQVLNGSFYKETYGARQGESKSLYGAVKNFINDGTQDSFVVIYGYNKELKANTFDVESTDNDKFITQNIFNEEYFLYTYSNIVYPFVGFKDSKNNDITEMFIRQ